MCLSFDWIFETLGLPRGAKEGLGELDLELESISRADTQLSSLPPSAVRLSVSTCVSVLYMKKHEVIRSEGVFPHTL